MADLLRPTAEPLPIDRLRILVDRAARHLTPAEGTAIREALAGTIHNATTAVQGLHQRAAEAEAALERARDVAVQLENENARLEDKVEQHVTANLEAANWAQQVIDQLREDLESCRRHNLAAGDRGIRAEARAEGAEQQLAQARALLAEHVQLADITHKYGCMGGHDSLGAGHSCAGCDLRDRTRTALDTPAGPADGDPRCCDNCHEPECPDWCDGPHHDTETTR